MRTIIALIAVFAATSALADELKCYDTGRLIYDGIVDTVTYTDEGFYIFRETKTGKSVMVYGNCVYKTKG